MNNYNNNSNIIFEVICLVLVPVFLAMWICDYKASLAILPIAVVISFTMAIHNVKLVENKQNEPDDFLSDVKREKVIRLRVLGGVCFLVAFVLYCIFGR